VIVAATARGTALPEAGAWVKRLDGYPVSGLYAGHPFAQLGDHPRILVAENSRKILFGHQILDVPNYYMQVRPADPYRLDVDPDPTGGGAGIS